jgi:hypothetical protein
MTRVLTLVLLLTVGIGPAALAAEPQHRKPPTRAEWIQDVREVMAGSGDYLRERTASSVDEALAVNLDIDNSTIASYYDDREAGAIRRVLRFARLASRLGVQVFFNTARPAALRQRSIDQLTEAGYPVDQLCMRRKGETRLASKQRCRAKFAAQGFTLIANVGNNPTDFAGGGYEVAYRLPNYGGSLA